MGRLIVSKQLEQATGANYLLQSDGSGNLQFVTAASIVGTNETVTDVTDNNDGTFDFTDEAAATTTVSIPYVFAMSGTYGKTASSLGYTKAIMPSQLNGKEYRHFYAYFDNGSGTNQTIALKKNGTNLATVTSLAVSGAGNVAISEQTVSTGDLLSVEFTTTPSGYSECHGTVVII